MTRYLSLFPALASAAVLLAGCSSGAPADTGSDDAAVAGAATAIPASLAPFGDGYPAAGDACRRLGEADATREWLDDTADLVGCPTVDAANALGGRILATVDGISVVSVPRAATNGAQAGADGDALVPGTNFNATADIRCSMDGSAPTAMCSAGVRRGAGPDGSTYVEITRPNGQQRVLVFEGTRPLTALGAEADGSSDYSFSTSRSGDETTISFGPERYIIPDAFVVGG